MRILLSVLGLAMLATQLPAQDSVYLDKSQGESAQRLVPVGETVRLYCKACSDVAYTPVAVESLEVQPIGRFFRLVLNGQPLDVTQAYVDSGYDDGWDNLASLLGVVQDSIAPKLPPGLDDASRLAVHSGAYGGTIGTTEVRMEMVVEERRLTGTYTTADGATARKVLATAYNATHKGETLSLVERGKNDRLTATLQGQLDAATSTFTGTRTPLDGSPAQPFELKRLEGDGE